MAIVKKDINLNNEEITVLIALLMLIGLCGLIAGIMVHCYIRESNKQPTPHFILLDLVVRQKQLFDKKYFASDDSVPFIIIQPTLYSLNYTDAEGIHYDQLDIHAEHDGMPITSVIRMPSSYQGPTNSSLWYPTLYSPGPPQGYTGEDKALGLILVNFHLVVDGIIRFELKKSVSDALRLRVSCPAVFVGGDLFGGDKMVSPLRLRQNTTCDVELTTLSGEPVLRLQ